MPDGLLAYHLTRLAFVQPSLGQGQSNP